MISFLRSVSVSLRVAWSRTGENNALKGTSEGSRSKGRSCSGLRIADRGMKDWWRLDADATDLVVSINAVLEYENRLGEKRLMFWWVSMTVSISESWCLSSRMISLPCTYTKRRNFQLRLDCPIEIIVYTEYQVRSKIT